jgi:hypothetical protein
MSPMTSAALGETERPMPGGPWLPSVGRSASVNSQSGATRGVVGQGSAVISIVADVPVGERRTPSPRRCT